MDLRRIVSNASRNAASILEAGRSRNLKVVASLLGPSVRGLVLQRGKSGSSSEMESGNRARFDWTYERGRRELETLYDAAKRSQWDAATALDWSQIVDPHDDSRTLLLESFFPLHMLPSYRELSTREKQHQRAQLLAWLLSQFLHGEQGALMAACQVTEAVGWTDAKLYGSTQVVDEGRHVEVFHRYLTEKLGKVYAINDNLYVIIDALMSDSRWDLKFLGMQILIEGLALGAFGTLRSATREPLLKELLRHVITDEARHVHFGVLALRDYYERELTEPQRREREDWAFEVSVLMRNRFLAHEFYDEFYAHAMSRATWDKYVQESGFMSLFRQTLFRRVIPNLKRIHLLSDRIRPHYEKLGMLAHEHEKAAPELTLSELMEGGPLLH